MSEFGFRSLIELCRTTHEQLQLQAARSIDTALVVRTWLFGWYIVEYESGGAERAEIYGRQLIDLLATELKTCGVKGCSPTNLRKFRSFYQSYPQTVGLQQAPSVVPDSTCREIQQTLSVESLNKFDRTP